MDELKMDHFFSEFKKELIEKLLSESEATVNIIPLVRKYWGDSQFLEQPAFCLRVQKLIQDYKDEGSIETNKDYHATLATLPGKFFMPKGVFSDQFPEREPEIYIRSTKKFGELYKEKLPPSPSAVQYYHYEDNSVKSGGNITGNVLTGAKDFDIKESFVGNRASKEAGEEQSWLTKYWWGLVIPLVIGLILLMIEYKCFSKN